MFIESVMPSNHLVLCCSNELALRIRCQSIEASASVLPINIQGLFLVGLTGVISLQFKGLSRVFSNKTVGKYQFFGSQPCGPTLTSTHDYWKVMSLLFNMMPRLAIAFFPRSKCFLFLFFIFFNFMAAVTICSDFGPQENKVCQCFHCFPIYLP